MLFLSKYVHLIPVERNVFCLYHSLSQKKIYIFSNLKVGKDKKIFSVLKKHRFLTSDYKPERKWLNSLKKKWRPGFTQLYLIVSEACNFRCKYCRQYCGNMAVRQTIMNFREAKEIIDWFFRQARQAKGVVFYGGEPMINADVILKCLEYIHSRYKKNIFKSNFDFTLITNGTLINEQLAKKFASYGLYIIVSLDGPVDIHNVFRVYANEHGTFKDVLRGYQIYQSQGCRVGISCTIGRHNYNKLPEVLTYIKKVLRPVNIGINLPHGRETNILRIGIKGEQMAKTIARHLLQFNQQGLYVEHVMRKIALLFRKQIKINDCPACGERLVVLPGKRVGVCEGAIGLKNFFRPWSKVNTLKKSTQQWFATSPLFRQGCQSCLALGVCGGGCPLDGYFIKKHLGGCDPLRCIFLKTVIEQTLKDFYSFVKKDSPLRKNQYYFASVKKQRRFLDSLKAIQERLPLRSSAQYGIINHFN